MKFDTPKAIIIGSIIVVVGFFLSDAYERQLSFNKCTRMLSEGPRGTSTNRSEWWIKKACEWNVYVMKGSWKELIPNFKNN